MSEQNKKVIDMSTATLRIERDKHAGLMIRHRSGDWLDGLPDAECGVPPPGPHPTSEI
jgi:hypothetical protein